MLNSSSSKVFFVVLITLLVQVFLFTSTTFISTALAWWDDYESFSKDVIRLETKLQVTDGKIFPSGNIGLTASSNAYSPFGSSGGTKFYANGDGTYNTITYPGYYSNDSLGGTTGGTVPTCPSGYELDRSSSCVPIYYPPSVSLSADLYKVKFNTATTLRWSSSNASSCSAGGGWSGGKGTSGSESTGELKVPTSFAIQCTDNIQTASAAVTVDIEYGVGAEIDAPDVVRKDTPTDVTWDVGTSEPRNCQLEAGSVILLPAPLPSEKGTFTHIVTAETTFTLNCEDYHNTDEKTVEVLPEFQET